MMHALRQILPTPVKAVLRPLYHGFFAFVRIGVRIFVALFLLVFGKRALLTLVHLVGNEIDTTVEIEGIRFDGSESRPAERAETLLTKEPDTIRWIDAYVKSGDIFYDVGANVGTFSLYAAMRAEAQVVAFEPMCTNYDILNKNLNLNALGGRAIAYNIAFHDETKFSKLEISGFLAGKSGHNFDDKGDKPSVFSQGMFGVSMDDFVFKFGQPFPNHIKIDVDGNEPKIIAGMKRILADERLKTLAIEMDLERRLPI